MRYAASLLRWLGLAALVFFVASMSSSCNDGELILRAKIVETRSELVGGPVAMADVGDYLLENDQIRVNILRAIDSPGPGVFGGSIVDIDRRRDRIEFQGGNGLDRFAEAFPVANLMVPEPNEMQVSVLKDGSDGQEAAIRVEGAGEYLFEALGVLRTKYGLLEGIFPNVRNRLRFTTDYILRPGARHILMRTTISLDDLQPSACPPIECSNSCENGYAEGPDGCVVCECSEVVPLDQFSEPVSVFGYILGDPPSEPDATYKAGVLAGDFVFFGNQNDVFAPGPGFDEEGGVQRARNVGRNTFEQPLTYDFVAAAGGDISYGYATISPSGDAVVNVPLFASAATAFLAGGKRCLIDGSDDATCDRNRTYTYERYLVVGDGDVASVLDEIYRIQPITAGEIAGHVFWGDTGEPAINARLFVLADPEPGRLWQNIDEVIQANLETRGDEGVVNAIDADLGLDRDEDGDFRAVMPVGDYVLVARDPDDVVTSQPISFSITAGERTIATPVLPPPATVAFRITDNANVAVPAKITMQALDAAGVPLEGDGTRRPYLGDGRLSNGVRHIRQTSSGRGEMWVEPGRYRITVSRGPEYGIHVVNDITLAPRAVFKLDATLIRQIDTSGWLSADMHLHSTPSFDSGMPLPRRVRAVAAEGVDLAISSDHDVISDYLPTIKELELEPYLAHANGAEITTLEQGHFIGFPMSFDNQIVPTKGAHDWTCQPGGDIIAGIRATGDGIVPFTIVAHPRDGFFGYIDQLGVDTFNMSRTLSLLEDENPVFRTASCDFDGMELISAKRMDLTRTPTAGEMVDYNRCLMRVDTAPDEASLLASCPELPEGWQRPCRPGELLFQCRDKNRTRLAWEFTKRMLTRTPEEQAASWNYAGNATSTEALCNVFELPDGPIPPETVDQPCAYRAGQLDDFFRFVERGLHPTQIGSSDSHGGLLEPGYPRTYFRSSAQGPAQQNIAETVESLRAGHAFPTYGPFVTASINGATYGEVGAYGDNQLALRVQTADWFGVDRIEIYVNGLIAEVVTMTHGPEQLLDYDGTIALNLPNDRDSWVMVVAMGLRDENLMSPVSLDLPFGDIQLAVVASQAFGLLPVVSSFFPPDPIPPDWSPIPALAITNPIFIDANGNGVYDAPLPRPDFCSVPCVSDDECPSGQVCLDPEAVCGVDVVGRQCNRRVDMDPGG